MTIVPLLERDAIHWRATIDIRPKRPSLAYIYSISTSSALVKKFTSTFDSFRHRFELSSEEKTLAVVE